MPVNPTYPGVYIEEIPSGVHTITGVPTSTTAFIGRTLLGPVNEPIIINSFGDFQRFFGGLQVDYPMSYAIQDFYMNGGSQAIIVRLYGTGAASSSSTPASPGGSSSSDSGTTKSDGGTSKSDGGSKSGDSSASSDNPASGGKTAVTTTGNGVAKLAIGTLNLIAASPGTWGNNLRGMVSNDGITDDVANRYGLPKADLFNLVIQYVSNGQTQTERIQNVSVNPAAKDRRIDRVLQSSQYVRITNLPATRPTPTAADVVKDSTKWPQASGGADGANLAQADYLGSEDQKTGIYALKKADLFNLLCIPPDIRGGDTDPPVYSAALDLCVVRRAMLIVDPPSSWLVSGPAMAANVAMNNLSKAIDGSGTPMRNAALYFPRIIEADPLLGGQTDTFPPSGMIAGIMARTDTNRGVWKAPAGLDAGLSGVRDLEVRLNDEENGMLNPLGINCLRSFPVNGTVVWGARTLRGADQLADEYKYVPVRRTALFIEESLYRGTQWVVFEPNDEPLWAQIRLNVGAFMHDLFRKGAFQGQAPKDAYFVKCDKETTTQNDINLGIVNILVGFAPLKPAEFVIIQLQQMAGQIEV